MGRGLPFKWGMGFNSPYGLCIMYVYNITYTKTKIKMTGRSLPFSSALFRSNCSYKLTYSESLSASTVSIPQLAIKLINEIYI